MYSVSALTVLHLNPKISDPQRMAKIPHYPLTLPTDAKKQDEIHPSQTFREDAMDVDKAETEQQAGGVEDNSAKWEGIWSDIGILSEKQFQTIVTKCIATLGERVSQVTLSRSDWRNFHCRFSCGR